MLLDIDITRDLTTKSYRESSKTFSETIYEQKKYL